MTQRALAETLAAAEIPPTGNRVGLALLYTGKRQQDLVEALALTPGRVSQIVNGGTTNLPMAQRIAQFFGVSVEVLFPAQSEVA